MFATVRHGRASGSRRESAEDERIGGVGVSEYPVVSSATTSPCRAISPRMRLYRSRTISPAHRRRLHNALSPEGCESVPSAPGMPRAGGGRLVRIPETTCSSRPARSRPPFAGSWGAPYPIAGAPVLWVDLAVLTVLCAKAEAQSADSTSDAAALGDGSDIADLRTVQRCPRRSPREPGARPRRLPHVDHRPMGRRASASSCDGSLLH